MMMDLLTDARTVSCIALAVRIMIVEMHTLSIRYALARRIHNIMFCTLFHFAILFTWHHKLSCLPQVVTALYSMNAGYTAYKGQRACARFARLRASGVSYIWAAHGD
jgi:hypothetical protein